MIIIVHHVTMDVLGNVGNKFVLMYIVLEVDIIAYCD